MQTVSDFHTAAPHAASDHHLLPIALPLAKALAVLGLSRSTLYREAGRGKIALLKIGRSTLVDMASARAFMASLPRAEIAAPKEAA
jgi:hypothetical protein